jgi:uncharacterized phage infection (PIP) family protein YhgE
MQALHTWWDWLLANPARLMVCTSIAFTVFVGLAEKGGKRSGGSGWLTLLRWATGAVFTIITAIVAAMFDGVRGFFIYGTVQVLVCLVIPALWLEDM